MCHRPEHELMFSADFSRSPSSGVGLIHTNPNWQCESWSPDECFGHTPHMSLTSSNFTALHQSCCCCTHAHTQTRTHMHAHTHTHTQRERERERDRERAQKLHYKHLLPWMSLKVVFQHCTITVRVLCHECPQKLVFIILIYLCPQKLVFNILYIFKDIFLSWISSS